MFEGIVKKAGENAGAAVGAGSEQVAGSYIDFMLSPWGIAVVVVIFLLVKAIR